jgi:hypothetical protein
VIWKDRFAVKIVEKHGVSTDEVEEVLFSTPHVRFAEKGHIRGDDMYVAYGQTGAGRYLMVLFIRKPKGAVLPISARDMTRSERRYYDAQKEAH